MAVRQVACDAQAHAVALLLARQAKVRLEHLLELLLGHKMCIRDRSFDREGLVMHCSSFSKSLAPGYRIGWVAGGRYAEQITRLKLMTTLSPSVPAQAALADYLQHGGYDRHLRKLRHCLLYTSRCV